MIEDVFFRSNDGTQLHGWYITATHPDSPVLLSIHGNAENVTRRRGWFEQLVKRGITVFAFDYRGYGRSEGVPIEQGIYQDAVSAYEYLRNERHVDAERITVLGHSLGGAISVELATRVQIAGLIVESSFTSISKMASLIVPVFPFRFFLRSKYDSIRKMRHISAPVLIVHGDKDQRVPFDLGRRLYHAANEPKSFYHIKGAAHGDIVVVGGIEYYERICGFIRATA